MPNKLTHLEHIEDICLDGTNKSYSTIVDIIGDLIHTPYAVRVQRKIDGAPSIIAGYDHYGARSGCFFIGTKSIFNKKPKINYTFEDIERNHPGPLGEKLKELWGVLSKEFPSTGIYQGDFLFGPGDKIYSGGDIYFKPNTLVYKIPKDSEHWEAAFKADYGIAWHTEYDGSPTTGLTISDRKVDIRRFYHIGAVWHIENTLDTIPDLNRNFYARHLFNELSDGQFTFEELEPILDLVIPFKRFINKHIRTGEPIPAGREFMASLNNFILTELNNVSEKKRLALSTKLVYCFNEINEIFQVHSAVTFIKNVIMFNLNEEKRFEAFVVDGDELKPTTEEGYVIITKHGMVKLVDRQSFSRLNFNSEKGWHNG